MAAGAPDEQRHKEVETCWCLLGSLGFQENKVFCRMTAAIAESEGVGKRVMSRVLVQACR